MPDIHMWRRMVEVLGGLDEESKESEEAEEAE
jgi:hypothetical protein